MGVLFNAESNIAYIYENVNIDKYKQVSAYLSARSAGYKAKKAKVFSEENIKRFIDQSEDLSWLDVKVVTIFGICGALRTDEVHRITLDDIEKHGDLFLVQIRKTKNKWPRSFTISGSFAVFVQKFIDLRPVGLKSSDRFFTNYQRGKCTRQFMGKNKFSNMPLRVAEYLGLPEPELHTGHSFRRTSATFLANSGADIETIMRHGGWRSASCAKEYIEDSLAYKTRTGDMIQRSIQGTAVSFASSSNVPLNAPNNVSLSAPMIQSPINAQMSGPISAPIQSQVDAPMNGPIQSSANLRVVPQATMSVVDASMNEPMSAPIQSPIDAPMNAPIQSSANLPVVPKASMSFVQDILFDSSISDDDLIQITDCATQSLEQSTQLLVSNDDGGRGIRDNSTVLTQSKSNSLNTILSRSFKSINFGRMENCHFNFHFGK